jgi:hypothetical protein
MSNTPTDNYDIYYADKLWKLLPAVYRALDTDQFNVNGPQSNTNGPLREMVNRIGVTTGAVRRSIDRLWDNQSIETCDDWVIPYIADLLDTRLVMGLDASRQRLDVANTISYRLRKGTLGVLEQIASDITGWDAKVVEFFRRLGRTRHGLDPPAGPVSAPGSQPDQLQLAEGIVGALTRTRIGGFADLRNVYGAGKSRSAFDEFFHTADIRMGQGVFGWHAIAHLGVFVWRLLSLPVGPVTPVSVQGCPGWYTFDPTGRDVPLFAARRGAGAFGDLWVSPSEGQLPTPISQQLLDADIKLGELGLGLYPVEPAPTDTMMPPAVMSVGVGGPPATIVPATSLTLRPARGRFYHSPSPPQSVTANYSYGFPSLIGAGPYDRRGQVVTVPTPAPVVIVTGGGTQLAKAGAVPGAGTVTINDSLTYTNTSSPPGALDVTVTGTLTLQAGNNQRPLLRLDPDPAQPWLIHGASDDSTLVMDGLFISGNDIVLTGTFAAVTLTCCTLDPGSAATPGVFANPGGSPPAALFQMSADGRELKPTRLWIEATITTLTIDRSVLGPIRTRGSGNVETTSISNSTLQAIRTADLGAINTNDVKDPERFERQLQLGLDPVSALLRTLASKIETTLGPLASPPLATPSPPASDLAPLVADLNTLIAGRSIYQQAAFQGVSLAAETTRLRLETTASQPAPALNRLLLEDAYPLELADCALAFGDGTLNLSRCTVMGRIVAHRFDASECILQELTLVDDLQDGCVRFSAWANGSVVPRQYESVCIPQSAPLFTTTNFGQPGYAQLLSTADLQRLPQTTPSTAPQNTISAGAVNGSEMGAYARDNNPIRAQALLLKLQEYMPASLVPVIVNVT